MQLETRLHDLQTRAEEEARLHNLQSRTAQQETRMHGLQTRAADLECSKDVLFKRSLKQASFFHINISRTIVSTNLLHLDGIERCAFDEHQNEQTSHAEQQRNTNHHPARLPIVTSEVVEYLEADGLLQRCKRMHKDDKQQLL